MFHVQTFVQMHLNIIMIILTQSNHYDYESLLLHHYDGQTYHTWTQFLFYVPCPNAFEHHNDNINTN